MERIESGKNPRIGRLVRLRRVRERRRRGQFLIEGRRECGRAVANGWELLELYGTAAAFADGLFPCRSAFLLPDGLFSKISVRENPDGILATAAIPQCALPQSLPLDALVLVAESLEKPGNLGALLRSAEAVGCRLLILADPLTDIWNPNAVRASQGAIFAVPMAICTSEEAVRFLKQNDVRIVAAALSAARCYWDSLSVGPLAIVVGNEHSGLTNRWLQDADLTVRIPMEGDTSDSLNVSVAAALLLYEALRLRKS
ncbi:MAG: RNA methyltransferase [Puniceicoccales bacterium]|jgi:TrmH family RNA methyltransferase|nr:RNA methyltransferase [Puniceicoccales bacterium]